MLLIATDEAGYGPKLGPLIIAATAWRLPGDHLDAGQIDAAFVPLKSPCCIAGRNVQIGDSKAVYKPAAGLDALHAVVTASHHWCGHQDTSLNAMLPRLAADDLDSIHATPWLAELSQEPAMDPSQSRDIVAAWQSAGIELVEVKTRVITAAKFNEACHRGGNKADLLSESTLGLVRALVELCGQRESAVAVYCDRHGGRRYYGAVLQHTFPESRLQILCEAADESAYRIADDHRTIDIRFTVKGDTFTPVALSSMHAKYLRERFMQSLNHYFAGLHQGSPPLQPTAGYPSDANRFLAQIATTLRRQGIATERLVRSR